MRHKCLRHIIILRRCISVLECDVTFESNVSHFMRFCEITKKWHRCFWHGPQPMESRDSEGVPFCQSGDSVTRHLADIGPWRVPKSGHVTIMKIENLHIDTRRKICWFQKCYSFRSTTNNNEVIAEKPFQNSGVTRRVWTLGRLELTLVVNTSF